MSLTLIDLSFAWPDGRPVLDGVTATIGPCRTGLVAPNGGSKTTLLRLAPGELSPTGGSVTVDGVLGHLPQDLPCSAAGTVAEVLGVVPVLAAITTVETGDVDPAHLETIGTDRDVEERAHAQLGRLGLGDVAFDRPLDALSGGQVVTIALAEQLLRRPDVLLLDEPTNNLDGEARARLYAVAQGWSGTLLVVSDDRELLEQMDRTAELDRGSLRVLTGGFADHEAVVAAEQEAAGRDVRGAQQPLRREKRDRQEARERAERRSGNAARRAPDAGIPKILAGARQRRAQESAGRADGTHAGRVDDARSRLDRAEAGLRGDERITLELPDTRVPTGRTVVEATGVGLRDLFPDGVDLELRGPERIALTGANGSGRSTLLRLLAGLQSPMPARSGGPRGGWRTCRSSWTASTRPGRWPTAWPTPHPTGPKPNAAPCWPASSSVPTAPGCRSARCPGVSGCGPPWPRCCKPGRHPSCCCWTSRRTTWTW